MTLHRQRFDQTRLHLVAAVMATTLSLAPGLAQAQGPEGRGEHVEKRIGDMHEKLKITASQEELWAKVAQVITENAQAMDALTQARHTQAGQMTAVDDLKSYGEIADTHAAGIRRLTPAFAALYESMSPPQQAAADKLFRHGERRGGKGRHAPRNDSRKPDVK